MMSKWIDYDAIDYRNDKLHDKSEEFIDGVIYMAQRIEEAPSIEIPTWMPCSERHPKDGRYYVTRIDYVTNTIFTDILWYEKGIWWNRQYTGDFAVIAWMPLPEPYGEREGE